MKKILCTWSHAFSGIALLAIGLAAGPNAAAADGPIGKEAARALPIADMHFHIMPWMKIDELVRYMDRNNIRWTGGAGPVFGPGVNPRQRNGEAIAALGKRYLPFVGQGPWIGIKAKAGVGALENADNPAFREAFAQMNEFLASGSFMGIGEIFVNTAQSAANESVRMKIRADAPTLRAMLDLAAKYQRPLAVHAQWDADTVEQLHALAAHNRQGILLLSHCGVTTVASDMRAFFERNPNAWCDISYRSPPQLKGNGQARAMFDRGGLRGDWKQLIEDMPDRFLLGIDDVYDGWREYQEVVDTLRDNLLAELTRPTAEKVAYRNAVKMLKLE